MRIKTHTEDAAMSVDMTPFIDTVFNLLIFFLVAGSFQQAEREMKIALPAASSAMPISATLREIVVNVTADAKIIVNGVEKTPEQLGELVKSAVAANPDQKVTVRGDRSCLYEHIVSVLDVCKTAGIQEPYLDTVLVN